MLTHLFTGICELVYPSLCSGCKKYLPARSPKSLLCPNCVRDVRYNLPPFCLKCSRHLNQNFPQALCHDCQKTKLHFDFAWAACLYNDVLKKLLYAFKYHQKTLYRHQFCQLMNTFIEDYNLDIQQFDLIAPIPLYPTRLRERGYNQSEMLAEIIAHQHHITLSTRNLIRVRHTHPQAQLSRKNRWTNIRGAFRIKSPAEVSGKSILIIDDLLTTGATVSEAAAQFKAAKATTVGVLSLAITH